MDIQDIEKIVALMDDYDLTHFHLRMEDCDLKLKKATPIAPLVANSLQAMQAPALPQALPTTSPPLPATPPTEEHALVETITSPMVGTFYASPSPEAPAYVEVGSTISKGQTLCIIEAMKVMNEIKSEKSGTIKSLLVEDGHPVQFGDALFELA